MIFLFNKKLLLKCDNFADKKAICLLLTNNNIKHKAVTKGISCFRRTGTTFWFNIYVSKKEYQVAKKLIRDIG